MSSRRHADEFKIKSGVLRLVKLHRAWGKQYGQGPEHAARIAE